MSEPIHKTCDALDLLKFIMAVMIVVMHSSFCSTMSIGLAFWPWVRMCVPIFFIISAYFFFEKDLVHSSWTNYLSFSFRIVLLYAIWFCISLPIISNSGMTGFCRKLFFSGLWGPTWFIPALIIAVGIIKLAAQPKSGKVLVFIIVVVSFLSCWYASLWHRVIVIPVLTSCVNYYTDHFCKLYWSFPIGLTWCGIGYLLARYEPSMRITHRKVLVALIVSFVLLWCEWVVVYLLYGLRVNDIYFFLIVACPLVFLLIKDVHINIKHSLFFRKASIIIFVTHIQILSLLNRMPIGGGDDILRLFVPVIIGCLITYVIMRLKEYRLLGFLKYCC